MREGERVPVDLGHFMGAGNPVGSDSSQHCNNGHDKDEGVSVSNGFNFLLKPRPGSMSREGVDLIDQISDNYGE